MHTHVTELALFVCVCVCSAVRTCMQRSDRGTVRWLLMGRHSVIWVQTSGALLLADLRSHGSGQHTGRGWFHLNS